MEGYCAAIVFKKTVLTLTPGGIVFQEAITVSERPIISRKSVCWFVLTIMLIATAASRMLTGPSFFTKISMTTVRIGVSNFLTDIALSLTESEDLLK